MLVLLLLLALRALRALLRERRPEATQRGRARITGVVPALLNVTVQLARHRVAVLVAVGVAALGSHLGKERGGGVWIRRGCKYNYILINRLANIFQISIFSY